MVTPMMKLFIWLEKLLKFQYVQMMRENNCGRDIYCAMTVKKNNEKRSATMSRHPCTYPSTHNA